MKEFNEVCLEFKYSNEYQEEAIRLSKKLEENNIDFVAYNINNPYYSISFVVRRCGKKWNDIMGIINSVKAAKYTRVRHNFYISNDVEYGNIQEFVNC